MKEEIVQPTPMSMDTALFLITAEMPRGDITMLLLIIGADLTSYNPEMQEAYYVVRREYRKLLGSPS